MSISLFKTLIAISEHGSFSAAADHVCISHAAVGQQMRRLEETLQVVLFDRTQRTPRLNQLGLALVPKAKAIVYAYDTILDDLTGDAQFIGELTLGAVPSTIRGLIPLSVKKLIVNYPDLHIRVVPGLSGDLFDQVARGALDAAVMSKPASLDRNLNWYSFAEEKLVLLTAPEITTEDPFKILRDMPFIRHTRRAAVGLLVEQWLQQNKVTVREAMVMESIETISSMVAHNLGVSIVPDLCVPDPAFKQLRKIRLEPNSMPRILGILTRSDCSKIRLVDRLREQIEITCQLRDDADTHSIS